MVNRKNSSGNKSPKKCWKIAGFLDSLLLSIASLEFVSKWPKIRTAISTSICYICLKLWCIQVVPLLWTAILTNHIIWRNKCRNRIEIVELNLFLTSVAKVIESIWEEEDGWSPCLLHDAAAALGSNKSLGPFLGRRTGKVYRVSRHLRCCQIYAIF